MKTRKGTIVRFVGHFMSGIAELVIDEENMVRGKVGEAVSISGPIGSTRVSIYCDNAPTVRALEGAFGNVIAEGHTVNQDAIRGKEIFFSTDAVGILEAFTPVDQAPPEMVEAYRRGD